MDLLTIAKSKVSVVVALDFGTTYSGFAYARKSDPEKIFSYYEWPHVGEAGGKLYCKTPTSLLYESGEEPDSYVLQAWGYSAVVKQAQRLKQDQTRRTMASHLLTLFKLHLAGSESTTSAADLPEGLPVRRVVADYLRQMAELVLKVVTGSLGSHISMEDIQWCLTVPAIWDERAKQEMITCAEIAGMVEGPECRDESPSPHPILIVLEPEAASLYCQKKAALTLNTGDKFLVVDVGGGTVDLVLHEKVGPPSSLKVREVCPSSGGLCGGTYIDKRFFEFLKHRISCFEEFATKQPDSVLKLKGWWEGIKYGFDGNMAFGYDLELPARLARAWEEDEKSKGWLIVNPEDMQYDAIELSLADMRSIFDPVIDEILALIKDKMVPDLKAMMIVGGFSGSPYLVRRIREEFSSQVGTITVPKEPGSAICCGAVLYGLYGADIIMSRISKKTYGIDTSRSFRASDPSNMMFQTSNGESYCRDVFSIFTRKGDEVPLDHCVEHTYYPLEDDQTEISVGLYSSSESNPKYVCDPGVQKEGSFFVPHPSKNMLGSCPEISVSMFFGRTTVEVTSCGKNFESEKHGMAPVRFEKSME